MNFEGQIYYHQANYLPVCSNIDNSDCVIVYEVLRIIKGEPVFFKEHLLRLKASVKSTFSEREIEYPEFSIIIRKLVETNKLVDINIRIELLLTQSNECWTVGMVPSFYPSASTLKNGVATDIIEIERPNPAVKVYHSEIQKLIQKKLIDLNVYELFLVNGQNCITEGSRSNLFFVGDKTVYTAPAKDVLCGITRQKVIEVVQKLRIPLIEAPISVNTIENFEGCFLTGTSPTVLPVHSVGRINFQVNSHIIQIIQQEYLHVMLQSRGY